MSIDQIIAAAQVLATIGGAAGAIATLRKRQDATDKRLDEHDERLDEHDEAILDLAAGQK